MNLLLDTGSSLTWVPGSNCEHSDSSQGKHVPCVQKSFKFEESKTFLDFSLPVNAEYEDGRIEGVLGNDNIYAYASAEFQPSARVNFAVASWTRGLEKFKPEGLLALAPHYSTGSK